MTTPQTDENVSPRTEAGRALHDAKHSHRFHNARYNPSCGLVQDILAIEAEAAPALDVERLALALRGNSEARGEWYCPSCWATHPKGYALPHTSMAGLSADDYWMNRAESVATEYARQSTDPEPPA